MVLSHHCLQAVLFPLEWAQWPLSPIALSVTLTNVPRSSDALDPLGRVVLLGMGAELLRRGHPFFFLFFFQLGALGSFRDTPPTKTSLSSIRRNELDRAASEALPNSAFFEGAPSQQRNSKRARHFLHPSRLTPVRGFVWSTRRRRRRYGFVPAGTNPWVVESCTQMNTPHLNTPFKSRVSISHFT